jgi:hypothetical protein
MSTTHATVRTLAGEGWRGWDRLSDRECRRLGVARGSIVDPTDPYLQIFRPLRSGGYSNTSHRAIALSRRFRPEGGF